MDRRDVERREAHFWDRAALALSNDDLGHIRTAFNKDDRTRLRMLGDLTGKRVLDVGCGSGEWSVILAKSGADVVAIDIAPEMVAATKRRADVAGLGKRVTAQTMSAMQLEFPNETFDVVHGQDIVHHVDPAEFGREVSRVLAAGGRGVFRETNGNNPILMFARDHLCGRFGISKWSSDDEYPLTPRRLHAFTRHFERSELDFPDFKMFFYLDAKIFRYRVALVTRLCKLLDGLIAATPLKRYSYRFLIAVTR